MAKRKTPRSGTGKSRNQASRDGRRKTRDRKRTSWAWKPKKPPFHQRLLWRYGDFERELNTELLLVGAGLKESQDSETILARHHQLFAPRHLKYARRLADSLPGRALPERADRLAWALFDGLVEKKLAKWNDAAASVRSQGTISFKGRKLPYHEVIPLLSRLQDAGRRESLWSAYVEFTEKELNPLQSELNRRRVRTLQRLGYASELEMNSARKRIDYSRLEGLMHTVAEKTDGVYKFSMRSAAKRMFGLRFPGMSRAHEPIFQSMREFDRLFPGRLLLEACDRTFRGLGLELTATPQLHVDVEDRPRKEPRAFCLSINAPEEVHLVIKPRGGAEDYAAYLHEAGHAWHYALSESRLPYEDRILARSFALTEVYAFLMEFLLQSESWLRWALGLDGIRAMAVSKRQRLADLYLLRRYIGKLTYELEFNRSPIDDFGNSLRYRDIMTAYTGIVYDRAMYLADIDTGLYSADYLRAWLAEAQLRHHIEGRFGPEWFRCAEAGIFLKGLWAKGDSWENEDLVRGIGAEPWDPEPLVRRYDDL